MYTCMYVGRVSHLRTGVAHTYIRHPGIYYVHIIMFVTVLVNVEDAEPELEGDGAIALGD